MSRLAVANHIHPIAPHPTERTQDSHPYPPQPIKASRHYDGLGVRGVIRSIVIKPKNPQAEWRDIFQNELRSYSEFLKNWPHSIQGMIRLAASLPADFGDALEKEESAAEENQGVGDLIVGGFLHEQKDPTTEQQRNDRVRRAIHFSQRQSSIHQPSRQQAGADTKHYANDKGDQFKQRPSPAPSLVSLAKYPNGQGDPESDRRPEPNRLLKPSEPTYETTGKVLILDRHNEKHHAGRGAEGQESLLSHETNPTPDLGKGQEVAR